MRSIEHFINGSRVADGTRHGDVWNPSQGEVQATVSLGTAADPAKGDRRRPGRPAGLGRDQPAAPRPRHVQFQGAGRSQYERARRAARQRAWQGHRRRQGRHSARAGSDRILLRHPARAEGRIYPRRRPRHRRLFDAPAARHRRRHHPVQLPGDDPDVDVRRGDRLRQRLHPEAQRTRPVGPGAPRRADAGSGPSRRHPERRPWRQGNGRRDPRP